MINKIQKSDLKPITYQQFAKLLDTLTIKMRKYCQKNNCQFDLIIPILRSGAFTAMHLASKLQIDNILPAQYRYTYQPAEVIIKKFEFPQLNYQLNKNSKILVVDTNTVYGDIAIKVIADTRLLFPEANLYFASANLDHSLLTNNKLDVKQIFYASLSNESRQLSLEEAKKIGVTNHFYIFPWENLEEQWQEIKSGIN